jgi:hypothetical protein
LAKRWRGFTEIEEQARRLRQRLGIDNLLCPDLIAAFAQLPQIFPGFELVRVPDDELPNCEAKADCYNKVIVVRQSVHDACRRCEPRARMTFAHELAHIALGHSGTRFRQANSMGFGPATRDVRREEAEAKQFAAAFLVPTYLARNCKSAEEIAEKFGISGEASEIPVRTNGGDCQAWSSTGATMAVNADPEQGRAQGQSRASYLAGVGSHLSL